MPGIPGTELAQRVRERFPETQVLIISGYADLEGIEPDIPRLTKPFREKDLAKTLEQLMSERASGPGGAVKSNQNVVRSRLS